MTVLLELWEFTVFSALQFAFYAGEFCVVVTVLVTVKHSRNSVCNDCGWDGINLLGVRAVMWGDFTRVAVEISGLFATVCA